MINIKTILLLSLAAYVACGGDRQPPTGGNLDDNSRDDDDSKYSEPLEPCEPAVLVEPIESSKPCEPSERSEATESSEPREISEPSESSESSEPIESIEPIQTIGIQNIDIEGSGIVSIGIQNIGELSERSETTESSEQSEISNTSESSESSEPIESIEPSQTIGIQNIDIEGSGIVSIGIQNIGELSNKQNETTESSEPSEISEPSESSESSEPSESTEPSQAIGIPNEVIQYIGVTNFYFDDIRDTKSNGGTSESTEQTQNIQYIGVQRFHCGGIKEGINTTINGVHIQFKGGALFINSIEVTEVEANDVQVIRWAGGSLKINGRPIERFNEIQGSGNIHFL